MIPPTFRNINRLLDLPLRIYFDKYYMPLVEIKDFYVLIENKQFFWSNRKK